MFILLPRRHFQVPHVQLLGTPCFFFSNGSPRINNDPIHPRGAFPGDPARRRFIFGWGCLARMGGRESWIKHLEKRNTLPETNIAPKNSWFPIGISFTRSVFSGAMLVSERALQWTGWWQLKSLLFSPLVSWGRFPIWLIFFKWVETTN